jgi:membrane-associated phospholipid phosphatase
MALLRIAAMYLMPLEPPPGIIELRDPFVEFFGGGRTLTRDLFFSGHTSTMFLLFLVMPGRRLRIAYACFTVIVGLCVVLQHVHYTVDVFAAPFFAYGAYMIVLGICKRRGIVVN